MGSAYYTGMRTGMRLAGLVLLAAVPAFGQTAAQPIGTMSDLMVKIIYPSSDAIFYITTRTPTSEVEWGELQGKALAVAESANLLMMPGRARDQDRWMADAKLMLDAGRAAYRAARAKDVAGLEAVNDQLYTSCTSCHQHYRPNYGRRPAVGGASGEPGLSTEARADDSRAKVGGSDTIQGRWKLLKAEDLRANGSVGRLPWGEHPIGSIVVERGA